MAEEMEKADPAPPTSNPERSTLTATERFVLEEKIIGLEETIRTAEAMAPLPKNINLFQSIIPAQVLTVSVALPNRYSMNDASVSYAVVAAIATVCDVDDADVKILSVDENGMAHLLVTPSTDFNMENDPNTIHDSLTAAFTNGKFVRELISNNLAVSMPEVTTTVPQITDVKVLMVSSHVTTVCRGSDTVCSADNIAKEITSTVSQNVQLDVDDISVVESVSPTSMVTREFTLSLRTSNVSGDVDVGKKLLDKLTSACKRGGLSTSSVTITCENNAISELPHLPKMGSACSGHGVSVGGACQCDEGWSGMVCEQVAIDTSFQKRLSPNVVYAELEMVFLNIHPSKIRGVLAYATATITNATVENILVVSRGKNRYMLVVVPSFDTAVHVDVANIRDGFHEGLYNQRFFNILNQHGPRPMVPITKHISVKQDPTVIDVNHWKLVATISFSCVANRQACAQTNISSAVVAEKLQLDPDDVYVNSIVPMTSVVVAENKLRKVVPSGVFTVTMTVHLMNSTQLANYNSEPPVSVANTLSQLFEELLTFQNANSNFHIKSRSAGVVRLQPTHIHNPPMGMDAACFGHGTLAADGTCRCFNDWKGETCSTRKCASGYPPMGATVLPLMECSGQGHCDDPWAVCQCDSGYAGVDCSLVLKCSEGTVQCSGHGSCTPNDDFPHSDFSCKCDDGWEGVQCDKEVVQTACPIGLGKSKIQYGYFDCSNRGVCQCNTHECKCFCNVPGWSGPACDVKVCPSDCHGHGKCFDGECLCNPEWTGPACDVPATCASDCSHRGECVKGECQCRIHFEGSACEVDACEFNGTAGNRRIVSVFADTDDSIDLLTWRLDEEPVQGPLPAFSHSIYSVCLTVGRHTLSTHGPAETSLRLAYTGFRKQNQTDSRVIRLKKISEGLYEMEIESECPGNPVCLDRGSCNHGKCCCSAGWEGDRCEVPIETVPEYSNCGHCPPHHVCDNAGRCVCTRALERAGICSASACPVNPDGCGVCSGHGDCLDGACVCDVEPRGSYWSDIRGWFGKDCGQPINCPSGCNEQNGHGTCNMEAGACVCKDGFQGAGCELTTCSGTPPCNGRGVCAVNGVCECGAEWEGKACETKRCVGGCGSGSCVDGTCVCAPHWTGAHCDLPQTCEEPMIFSNCTDPVVRSCNNPASLSQVGNCIPGCTCPRDRPLWDETAKKCVKLSDCANTCYGQLDPKPHELAILVQPQRTVAHSAESSSVHICAHHTFRVCYKAGEGLLNIRDEGSLIAHARRYHAPIGFVIYDEHGNRIGSDWAKVTLESNGQVNGLFGADAGYVLMSVSHFGPLDLRYYVIGPSSTAPIFISSVKLFSSDCDTSKDPLDLPTPPQLCTIPTVANASVECSGRVVGSTCHIKCEDGYVLNNPLRSDLTCLANGWDVPVPSCIELTTASGCPKEREGDFCLPLTGDVHSGICEQGSCVAVSSSSFCGRAPVLTGESCEHCQYICNAANSRCEARCYGIRMEGSGGDAVCLSGFAGGWWSGVSSDRCIYS
eukprot:c9031_g1_i1.p1 GENE.c9031_g1_i1~~c9031_g1_i1.p1  ORF type:complete len:1603 (-),score=452.69 c9031_g1_i1:60-4607(-)